MRPPDILDHPRSRGVYEMPVAQLIVAVGSSPLARGLRRRGAGRAPRIRIIPARAGFTHAAMRASITRSGSSPLARGLPPRHGRDRHGRRIIPARAGFTEGRRRHGRGHKDHPRSRGVYAAPPPSRGHVAGSSPLARGLRPVLIRIVRRHRIIPARAGFTFWRALNAVTRGDHPRSRGVYHDELGDPLTAVGSSPLARGLPPGPAGLGREAGIIPARAGFTLPH